MCSIASRGLSLSSRTPCPQSLGPVCDRDSANPSWQWLVCVHIHPGCRALLPISNTWSPQPSIDPTRCDRASPDYPNCSSLHLSNFISGLAAVVIGMNYAVNQNEISISSPVSGWRLEEIYHMQTQLKLDILLTRIISRYSRGNCGRLLTHYMPISDLRVSEFVQIFHQAIIRYVIKWFWNSWN